MREETGKGPSRHCTLALCEEPGLALPKKPRDHLHELAHSSSHFSFCLLPAGLQPLPQIKQQWGQTCCLPNATETTEAQAVLPTSGSRKFPHAPGVTRKGSGSACWQGPGIAEHLAFGRRDSAVCLMFIRYFVSLQFSGVQLSQDTVEAL